MVSGRREWKVGKEEDEKERRSRAKQWTEVQEVRGGREEDGKEK